MKTGDLSYGAFIRNTRGLYKDFLNWFWNIWGFFASEIAETAILGGGKMAKKKRHISIIAVILILTILLIVFFVVVRGGDGCSVGRYLEASNGNGMVVLGNASVQMSNQTKRNLFDALDTGDKILVIHDGVDTAYPGRTGVYAILKLEDGNIDDIPPAVVNSLIELGWLTAR